LRQAFRIAGVGVTGAGVLDHRLRPPFAARDLPLPEPVKRRNPNYEKRQDLPSVGRGSYERGGDRESWGRCDQRWDWAVMRLFGPVPAVETALGPRGTGALRRRASRRAPIHRAGIFQGAIHDAAMLIPGFRMIDSPAIPRRHTDECSYPRRFFVAARQVVDADPRPPASAGACFVGVTAWARPVGQSLRYLVSSSQGKTA
jgi:hypothetical protein